MSGESAVSRMTVVDMPWLQAAEVRCLHAGYCFASPGNILHRSLSLIRPSTRGREARSFTKEMC